MVKKLSISEAYTLIGEAFEDVKGVAGYRLGQALYNLSPLQLSRWDFENNEDHFIFYNSEDQAYCVEYFWEHYVQVD